MTSKNRSKTIARKRHRHMMLLALPSAVYRLVQHAAGIERQPPTTFATRATVAAARAVIKARVEAAQVQLVAEALSRRGLAEQVEQQEEASDDASNSHGP